MFNIQPNIEKLNISECIMLTTLIIQKISGIGKIQILAFESPWPNCEATLKNI